MSIFSEKSRETGIFYISNRYHKAISYDPKWIDPKKFDLKKCTRNSSKGCFLKFVFKYPKGLQELHSGYRLVLEKKEIKPEILPDLCNIPIGNVKNSA